MRRDAALIWPRRTFPDQPRWLDVTDLAAILVAAPALLLPGKWLAAGLLAVAVSWLIRWLATGRPTLDTGLDIPATVLAIMAVVAFAASPLPVESRPETFGILLGIAAFYALANRGVRMPPSGPLRVLAVVGVVWALIIFLRTDWHIAAITPLPVLTGIYARLFAITTRLTMMTPAFGPPFNPRELGGVVSLVLPAALMGAGLNYRPAGIRWIAWAVSAVLIAMTVLSQSISAIAGLLGGLWLAALLIDRHHRKWWLAAGAGVASIGIAGLWWALGGPLSFAQRITAASRPQPGVAHLAFGVESRLEIWQRALQMLHDMPYSGIGPGSFRSIMDSFYPGFLLGAEPHAHNILLQAGVDLGVPGLVGFVWLIAAFGLRLTAVYRHSESPTEQRTAAALAAGLVAYLLFGTIDVISLGGFPGLLVWLLLALGVVLAYPVRPRPWERSLNWVFAATLGVGLVVPISWDGVDLNWGRILAERGLLAAQRDAQTSDLVSAQAYLNRAARTGSADARTWYLLAADLADTGEEQPSVLALRYGVRLDSVDPLPRYSPLRGVVRPQRGTDWPGLERVYSQWMKRYPRRAEWYAAGAIAMCEGRHDFAGAQELLASGAAASAQPVGVLSAAQSVLDRCSQA